MSDSSGQRPTRRRQHSHSGELRRLKWALAVTAAIMVAEIAGGLYSGSLALISDAGHMFVDSISLGLSYLAVTIAQRNAGENYTFGLHRIEIIAALVNGATLLIVCAYIVYEGIQRFLSPIHIDVPAMLAVSFIGITANIFSAVILKHAHTLNVRSAFLHVLGDLFSSAGILIAGFAMLFWNVPWLDPALSIVIAAVILISAYRLTSEALSILMEAAPSDIPVETIRSSLMRFPFISDVHDLHIWTITTGRTALVCHIVLKKEAPENSEALLTEITSFIREEFSITHVTIQFEPADAAEAEMRCITNPET